MVDSNDGFWHRPIVPAHQNPVTCLQVLKRRRSRVLEILLARAPRAGFGSHRRGHENLAARIRRQRDDVVIDFCDCTDCGGLPPLCPAAASGPLPAAR